MGLETDKKLPSAIHKDVALRGAEILRNGLSAEEVKKLMDKYPPPENRAFISVPKLDAEIIAALQESAIKQYKRIVEKQERISVSLGALGKAISNTLKIEGPLKIELLENLSEMGRLPASVHRKESLARKSLILANLNASLKQTLSNTNIDKWQFGGDLEIIIKTAKTLERVSNDLKPLSKPTQQWSAKKLGRPSPSLIVQESVRRQSTTIVEQLGAEKTVNSQGESSFQDTLINASIDLGKPARRLRFFHNAWAQVTHDSVVRMWVKGFEIPFRSKPWQKSFPGETEWSNHKQTLIKGQIDILLNEGAIEKCLFLEDQFLSSIFLVPKPYEIHRLILNLKRLNKFVKKDHFKIEDWKVAKRLIGSDEFMASL